MSVDDRPNHRGKGIKIMRRDRIRDYGGAKGVTHVPQNMGSLLGCSDRYAKWTLPYTEQVILELGKMPPSPMAHYATHSRLVMFMLTAWNAVSIHELTAARVVDWNKARRVFTIRSASKERSHRIVHVRKEAAALLDRCSRGREPDAWLFLSPSGSRWLSAQYRQNLMRILIRFKVPTHIATLQTWAEEQRNPGQPSGRV